MIASLAPRLNGKYSGKSRRIRRWRRLTNRAVRQCRRTLPTTAFVMERGMPPRTLHPRRKSPPCRPSSRTTTRKAEFQPLFNGKDLTGWKTDPKQPGNWHVENGVLVGSGPSISHLYTERDDFTDFHLRVEARFNKGGSSGVYFRCPFGPSLPADDPKWPDGFEATINNARIVRDSTGGLYPGVGNEVFITDFTHRCPSDSGSRWR